MRYWKHIIAICKSEIKTVLFAIIGTVVACVQCGISKEQKELEQQENQPIFSISILQQPDGNDGIYGTDILEIRNIGSRPRSLCSVSVRMFFMMTHEVDQRKSVYLAEVGDYFSLSSYGNGEDSLLYHAFTIGNNRKYLQVYRDAMSGTSSPDECYFIDRVILVRISYKDVYGEEHTLYFNGNEEIDEKEYDSYSNHKSDRIYVGRCNLSNISFYKLKTFVRSK